jgi:hypothetical protein
MDRISNALLFAAKSPARRPESSLFFADILSFLTSASR